MIRDSDFRAPAWARSPHMQTLWGPMFRRIEAPQRRTEKMGLDDGDHLWLHHAGPEPGAGQSRVLLLHGLSGCADSHYMVGLQRVLAEQAIPSTVMNARGAFRPNDRARSYHAAETGDLDELIRRLHERDPSASLLPVGVSLGGSRLLNWLADGGHPAVPVAVAVSVPLNLGAGSVRLDQGLSRLYRNHLLKQLLAQQQAKRRHLWQVAPTEAERHASVGPLTGIRTFRDFDTRIVAPLHGFRDARDYYERASAGPRLRTITTPTRLIQAADDPFMTPACRPTPDQLGSSVTLEASREGGHVGFVQGSPLNPRYWLEQRIPAFLADWTG
jgi:predicted alpha/beta-fold hydrolase